MRDQVQRIKSIEIHDAIKRRYSDSDFKPELKEPLLDRKHQI